MKTPGLFIAFHKKKWLVVRGSAPSIHAKYRCVTGPYSSLADANSLVLNYTREFKSIKSKIAK